MESYAAGGVYSGLHMEHVDVARNPETVDILNVPVHHQQQRELSDIERQHQFSLISPDLTLTQTYVGSAQPTGVTLNSADDSFRITGNGICCYYVCTMHVELGIEMFIKYNLVVTTDDYNHIRL